MKKNIIRKHNEIIQACYSLTSSELRLIYSCISKIDYEQLIDEDNIFEINVHDYADTFNLQLTNARRDLKKAVERIWGQSIIIKNGAKNGADIKVRWLSSFSVPDTKDRYKNDTVEIRFSSQIIPYLTNLKDQGNFTLYKLENISDLKSSHSIRLYEIMKKFQKISPQTIQMNDLREMFCLNNKYSRMKDFKGHVLDKAVEEINMSTDIKIKYENIKRGKTISGFKFTIKENKKSLENKTEQNTGKKYLTETEITKMAQSPKFIGKTWPDIYNKLNSLGYTFERKHKY
jgi:plasmid replication initiation protein